MKENLRISEMVNDLHDGHPWIDVTFQDTLKFISAADASKNIPGCNSIWQLLEHIINWRKLNRERLQGMQIPSPGHNFILPVENASEQNWKDLLNRFNESQKEWNEFVLSLSDEDLDRINETNKMSYYKQVHGILQHDAYHLGQIVLLAKLIKRNDL